MTKKSVISRELITAIQAQVRIDWFGKHGISHWARVYEIGMKLAGQTGANRDVVELFSVFHDAGRHNEHNDPQHGPRGAMLAGEFHAFFFPELKEKEFILLQQACSLHTLAASHADITVQTCFDADRLDLGRVGKVPDPQFLCTDAAKDSRMLDWAYSTSIKGWVPDNIVGNFARQSL
jgi:uncharacterized protein